MLVRTSSAVLTQTKSLGSALCVARYTRMASSSARRLRWLPRRICLSVSGCRGNHFAIPATALASSTALVRVGAAVCPHWQAREGPAARPGVPVDGYTRTHALALGTEEGAAPGCPFAETRIVSR